MTEAYVEIQLLTKHGMSLRQIAREVNCAINTVRSHLTATNKPKYDRKVKHKTKLADYGMVILDDLPLMLKHQYLHPDQDIVVLRRRRANLHVVIAGRYAPFFIEF